MFRLAILLTFLFSCFSVNAQAGFRRGNGGFVLVCQKDQGTTYQLLDLFEAESRYGFQLSFAPAGDEYERAQGIIDRLRTLNPTRYHLYSDWLKEFRSQSRFLENLNIITAPDIGVTFIPDYCVPKQLVVQVEPVTSFDSRYTIDQRLWEKMDTNHRAAAIIHELIYREAISFENQHNSSEPSRTLNAYLHSTLLPAATLQSWLTMLQDLGFHRADAHGLEIRLNYFVKNSNSDRKKSAISFYNSNTVLMAYLPWSLEFNIIVENPRYYQCLNNLQDNQDLSIVNFYPDGRWQRIQFSSPFSIQRCPDFYLSIIDRENFYASPFSGNVYAIEYDKQGRISMLYGAKNDSTEDRNTKISRNKLFVQGKSIFVYRNFEDLTQAWSYQVHFEEGKPSLLVNDYFNTEISKTYLLKEPGEKMLLPNQGNQVIY